MTQILLLTAKYFVCARDKYVDACSSAGVCVLEVIYLFVCHTTKLFIILFISSYYPTLWGKKDKFGLGGHRLCIYCVLLWITLLKLTALSEP